MTEFRDVPLRGRTPRNLREAVAKMEQPRIRLSPGARRDLILKAAAAAFGAHGYDGVTLDTIAGAAYVTKPVLYRHFDSKDALYLALLERHREDLPTFVDDLPPGKPLGELVPQILEAWFSYAEDNGDSWRMIFRDSGGSAEIKEARERMRADARRVLAGFLHAHPGFEIPEEDVDVAAEMLRGGLSSLVLYGQEHPEATRAALVENGTRLVLGLAGAGRA
jgi:AcrR family transcriptional regulator